MGLLISLANAKELPHPTEGDAAIYYDYLGAFMIVYSNTTGIILNVLVSVLAICVPLVWQISDEFPQHIVPAIFRAVSVAFVFLICTGISMLATYLLALIFGATGKTMTW